MHAHIGDTTLRGLLSHLDVLLDGARLVCCIEACEEGGWARVRTLAPPEAAPGSRVLVYRAVRPLETSIRYGEVRLVIEHPLAPKERDLWERVHHQRHICHGPEHEWPDGFVLVDTDAHSTSSFGRGDAGMEQDDYGEMFQFRLGHEVRTADHPSSKRYVTQRRFTQRRIFKPLVEYQLGSSVETVGGEWVREEDVVAWDL
jgi:hypothetical protein